MKPGILKNNASLFEFCTKCLDFLAVIFCAYTAFYIRFLSFHLPDYYAITLLIALLITFAIFSELKIYRSWRGKSLLCEIRNITLALSLSFFVLSVVLYLSHMGNDVSRAWLAIFYGIAWLLISLQRIVIRGILYFFRRKEFNLRSIVIVGAGTLGKNILSQLNSAPWSGLKVAAFFDDDPTLKSTSVENIPIIGNLDTVSTYLSKNDIDQIWLALPLNAENRIKALLSQICQHTIQIRFIPDVFGFDLLNHRIEEVAGVALLTLTGTPLYGLNYLLKQVEDKTLSCLILLLISPLLSIIAIAVKLSSKGPVFYKQERMTWNGKKFNMLKFRSMPVGSEAASGPVWAKKEEARATTLGKFLRKTSLDELPQFINVLKGDMSIVGPRPERPIFVNKFKHEIPSYMKKHLMKAGITGWAQINGWRGNTDLQKRIECDLYYIENWSLWLDIKIILLTLVRGFIHKNAY